MLNTHIGENYNANDVINSNDLRKRILNIDSRFRAKATDPTTAFTYNVEHPYKNLIRLRVASVEIPNMMYVFTSNNNSFRIKAYDITGIVRDIRIVIEEGNYTSDAIMTAIQSQLDKLCRDPYGIFLSVEVDPLNAKVTFIHNGVAPYPVISAIPNITQSAKPFILDFISTSPISYKKRTNHFGLGFNLGFRKHVYKVTTILDTINTITRYSLTSESCLDVVGDTYMFLAVNDYYTVEQKTTENYLQVLAKIIIREDRYAVIYDDGSSCVSNEIIFPSPTDLKILQVKLLDPYGEIVDLHGMNFSFSLEITEVLNTSLYDFYRNYIWLGTTPSVNYRTVRGSAQPLLKGIGPPW